MKKTTIKKILAAVSAITLMGAMAGCGEKNESTAIEEEKKKVAVIHLNDNDAFLEMKAGFVQWMNVSDFDIEIVDMNAQGDTSTMQAYVQEAVSGDVDLIATIGTAATQAVVATGTDKPNVFIAVSDPVGAQILTSMDKPDKNSTGTQNPIPVSKIFESASKLTPNVKKYGILYTEAQPNAVDTAKKAKDYLDSKNIEYVEKTVTTSADVQQAVDVLLAECDALYIPNDTTIQEAMPVVAEAAKKAKKPLYGSSKVMTKNGALMSVAISDMEIGELSGQMAEEILAGTPVSDVPAQAVEGKEITVNKTTAAALGVTVPADMEVKYLGE